MTYLECKSIIKEKNFTLSNKCIIDWYEEGFTIDFLVRIYKLHYKVNSSSAREAVYSIIYGHLMGLIK